MNVTPFGAKSSNNTVVGVAADATGNLTTKKVWNNNVELIYEMNSTPSGTSTIWINPVDLSDCGAVSLRITNSMDVNFTLYFGTDIPNDGTAGHYALKDIEGTDHTLTIPASTNRIVLTPDDVPLLQWINTLNLAIKPASTPSTGAVKIWLVRKR